MSTSQEKVQEQKTNIQNIVTEENQPESTETHYKELIKIKEERFEKLNQKYASLEMNNEKIENQFSDLTEENKILVQRLKESEQKSHENEGIYKFELDKKQKKCDDMKRILDTWEDFDLSKFMQAGQINLASVQKKLTYYTEEKIINKRYIEILQEMIKNLEAEIICLKSKQRISSDTNETIFDKLFGKANLKNEIKQLLVQIQCLNEKHESIITLMKVHELNVENNEKEINELENQVKIQQEFIKITETENKELRVKKEDLTAANDKKDLALDKMRGKIDTLINDNIKNKEESNLRNSTTSEEVRFTVRNLEGKLNKADLEYAQLELKYKNACEEIEKIIDQKEKLEQNIKRLENNENDVVESITKESVAMNLSSPTEMARNLREVLYDNTRNQYPSTVRELQVFEQIVEDEVCPNCNRSFPNEHLENHLDKCLEDF